MMHMIWINLMLQNRKNVLNVQEFQGTVVLDAKMHGIVEGNIYYIYLNKQTIIYLTNNFSLLLIKGMPSKELEIS